MCKGLPLGELWQLIVRGGGLGGNNLRLIRMQCPTLPFRVPGRFLLQRYGGFRPGWSERRRGHGGDPGASMRRLVKSRRIRGREPGCIRRHIIAGRDLRKAVSVCAFPNKEHMGAEKQSRIGFYEEIRHD